MVVVVVVLVVVMTVVVFVMVLVVVTVVWGGAAEVMELLPGMSLSLPAPVWRRTSATSAALVFFQRDQRLKRVLYIFGLWWCVSWNTHLVGTWMKDLRRVELVLSLHILDQLPELLVLLEV